MGDAAALTAVADAGPIIHLHEIGALSLLNVFTELHVPDAVWDETVGVGRVDAAAFDGNDHCPEAVAVSKPLLTKEGFGEVGMAVAPASPLQNSCCLAPQARLSMACPVQGSA